MKKLSLYERLSKNKNRLKLQVVSLVLAATAVVTTGCGKTNPNKTDVNKPGIVDVINDYSNVTLTTEEVEPITAENFDLEVEKLVATAKEKGLEISKEEIAIMLFIGNTYNFSPEDYYDIYERGNDNAINKGIDASNTIMKHNTDYKEVSENYFGYEQFCRNPQDKAVLGFFDNLNLDMINCYVNKGEGYKEKIDEICKFFCDFGNNQVPIKVDGEELYLTDLSKSAIFMISSSGVSTVNMLTKFDKNNEWHDKLWDTINSDNFVSVGLDIDLYNPYEMTR